ncbi:hypothetical protein FOS14_23155 [Skermania sp. ID1734]|uniref:DUF6474 family protein n=1 Tax=Skermania sp. ID1734 TaxID=2597516 RepID=UPI00117EA4DC|nr:DUF6474 family protein [Skermania sp. ID1734]TSD93453.1 hypothetical protein FOS14_23155 [Skermania sp. ID1734]
MGLFRKRKRKGRAARKAERKAREHKAKLEVKQSAKADRKRLRQETKAARKVARAQVATLKAQQKAAEKAAAKADREVFSPGQMKKYLGVARVLSPVLMPLAYRGATLVRGQLDQRRANRLGVGVAELGEFTGHGARLSSRLAHAETSTAELLQRHPKDSDAQAFAAATRDRLADLSTAIRTAELMPAARRRAAHQAISNELDGIEADLLARLGVR